MILLTATTIGVGIYIYLASNRKQYLIEGVLNDLRDSNLQQEITAFIPKYVLSIQCTCILMLPVYIILFFIFSNCFLPDSNTCDESTDFHFQCSLVQEYHLPSSNFLVKKKCPRKTKHKDRQEFIDSLPTNYDSPSDESFHYLGVEKITPPYTPTLEVYTNKMLAKDGLQLLLILSSFLIQFEEYVAM